MDKTLGHKTKEEIVNAASSIKQKLNMASAEACYRSMLHLTTDEVEILALAEYLMDNRGD